MFYRRRIDPSAYLVLWQVGVAGDRSFARFSTGAAYRQVLVDVLSRDYDTSHEVISSQAATLPMHKPRIERLALGDLPGADIDMQVTVVLPPGKSLQADLETRNRLAELDLAVPEAM
jgi:hypothetical protein